MSAQIDPYAVLGLPRRATAAEVARAYRQQVRRYHPDTARAGLPEGTAAEARTALGQVQAAYDLLRDRGRRTEYDLRHPVARAASAQPSRPGPRPSVSIVPDPDQDARPPLWAGPVSWRPP